MKQIRKIIEINEELCDGCGECIPNCAEGSLKIVDGKVKLVAENLCDGLGACLGVCPNGALRIIERQADDFDEEAVDAYLRDRQAESKTPPLSLNSCQAANRPEAFPLGNLPAGSLSHWPVKLRLVAPTAPFLKNADLLVAADCCPVACRDFHEKYLNGHVVVLGCPKFDDKEFMRERLIEIFTQGRPQSVTVLIMDVPCCSGLQGIVRQAARSAGFTAPLTVVTLSRTGRESARQS